MTKFGVPTSTLEKVMPEKPSGPKNGPLFEIGHISAQGYFREVGFVPKGFSSPPGPFPRIISTSKSEARIGHFWPIFWKLTISPITRLRYISERSGLD